MQKANNLLLDTHVWIWASNGEERVNFLENHTGTLFISAISVWEVAMLNFKKRIHFTQTFERWIDVSLRKSSIQLVELEPEISMLSCQLKGDFHGDPADRIIVASAMIQNIPLVSADEKIISYCKKHKIKLIEV